MGAAAIRGPAKVPIPPTTTMIMSLAISLKSANCGLSTHVMGIEHASKTGKGAGYGEDEDFDPGGVDPKALGAQLIVLDRAHEIAKRRMHEEIHQHDANERDGGEGIIIGDWLPVVIERRHGKAELTARIFIG